MKTKSHIAYLWLAVGLCTFAAVIQCEAQTTFGYNFKDGAITPSSGSSARVTAGAFSIGNIHGSVSTTPTTASSSSGYIIATEDGGGSASGTYNLGNAARVGALSLGTSAYYSVTLTPVPGYAVQVTNFDFGIFSTSTGPLDFTLRDNLDNDSTSLLSGTIANNSTWAFEDNNHFLFTGALNASVEFRLYVYGNTGTADNSVVNVDADDLFVTADGVIIPEPSTLLGGLLLLGIVGWRVWHRSRNPRVFSYAPAETGSEAADGV